MLTEQLFHTVSAHVLLSLLYSGLLRVNAASDKQRVAASCLGSCSQGRRFSSLPNLICCKSRCLYLPFLYLWGV